MGYLLQALMSALILILIILSLSLSAMVLFWGEGRERGGRGVPILVFLILPIMLTTVCFNDEFSFCTVEVDYIIVYAMLTSKFISIKTSRSQLIPLYFLCFTHVLTQRYPSPQKSTLGRGDASSARIDQLKMLILLTDSAIEP